MTGLKKGIVMQIRHGRVAKASQSSLQFEARLATRSGEERGDKKQNPTDRRKNKNRQKSQWYIVPIN